MDLFDNPPYDVIDANDILFFGVFRVAHDGRARLQPREPAALVHQSIVMRQHLALIDY